MPRFIIANNQIGLTQDAADALYAPLAHTHLKAEITDLEVVTATPTAGAIPKANGSGKLDAGWLPNTASTDALVFAIAL